MLEIHKAKHRFGLPEETPVISCYEAGRDGFWLHRYLEHQGIENLVVDAASIEVNRRQRRAKSDNLDATKLVSMLIRWHLGEKMLWAVVHVPTVADEDRRQLHRELIDLKAQRTEHANRIKGLLAVLGLSVCIDAELPLGARLDGLRRWTAPPCRLGCGKLPAPGVPESWQARRVRTDPRRWRRAHRADPRPLTPLRGSRRQAAQAQGDRPENTAWLLVLRSSSPSAASATAGNWGAWPA